VAQAEAQIWPRMRIPFTVGEPSWQPTRDHGVETKSSRATPARGSSTAQREPAIFQWGAYKNQARSASLGVKIAERQYADAYRQLAVLIREQYMALIYKKMCSCATRAST
jgi:outer membrane protein TolC